MSSAAPDLPALLGSRICHDLISPIGAIANGVELLRLTGAANGPEIELIAESAAQANARIRFFRVAFGAAHRGQSLSASEIRSILADPGAAGRLAVDWQAEGGVPRAEARLVFLLLQCLEAALPAGGAVQVDRQGDGWRLSADGPRIAADPELWSALSGGSVPAQAAQVQFLLAAAAAEALGRRIGTHATEDGITITV